jgi:hypothetical protein
VRQLKAVAFILLCKVTVHVLGASCTHHQEYIKTLDAITGTVHVSVWFKSVERCPRFGFHYVMAKLGLGHDIVK